MPFDLANRGVVLVVMPGGAKKIFQNRTHNTYVMSATNAEASVLAS